MAGSAFQRDRDIRIAAVSDGLEPAAIVLRPHALFSAQLCRLLIRSSADQRKLTLQCLPGGDAILRGCILDGAADRIAVVNGMRIATAKGRDEASLFQREDAVIFEQHHAFAHNLIHLAFSGLPRLGECGVLLRIVLRIPVGHILQVEDMALAATEGRIQDSSENTPGDVRSDGQNDHDGDDGYPD